MKVLHGIIIFVVGYVITTMSCQVFNPNFLVGTWIGTGEYGDNRLSFTKDASFSAVIYNKEGVVEKINGTYIAGYSVIKLSFNGKQRSVAYTLYKDNIELIWKGKKIYLFRFK